MHTLNEMMVLVFFFLRFLLICVSVCAHIWHAHQGIHSFHKRVLDALLESYKRLGPASMVAGKGTQSWGRATSILEGRVISAALILLLLLSLSLLLS